MEKEVKEVKEDSQKSEEKEAQEKEEKAKYADIGNLFICLFVLLCHLISFFSDRDEVRQARQARKEEKKKEKEEVQALLEKEQLLDQSILESMTEVDKVRSVPLSLARFSPYLSSSPSFTSCAATPKQMIFSCMLFLCVVLMRPSRALNIK